ncbi:14971_t:CDS:2, partial [Racocetra persica]
SSLVNKDDVYKVDPLSRSYISKNINSQREHTLDDSLDEALSFSSISKSLSSQQLLISRTSLPLLL